MNSEPHKEPHKEKELLRDEVLRAIKNGRVQMRPKRYFIFHAALLVVGALIVLLALLYVASFTLFALRRTGVWFVPIFGARGWYAFLVSVPWVLVAISLIFVGILEALVRRFSFAYRRPLLYSILGIVLLALAGAFAVDQIHVHGRFSRFAEEHRVPFMRELYRSPRFRNIHEGIITEITASGFLFTDRRGERISAVITARTRLPLGQDFSVGDTVVVFGDRSSGTVESFGVRKIMHECCE